MKRDRRGVAVALGVAAQFLQRLRHVGRLRLLAAVAAREGEIVLQHARHLVDILAHGVDFRTVADQRQFELEAGQDGAQIVRHAGQHRGALLDRALDARFHLQERLRGAAHLARPAGAEVGRLASLAEALGGIRKTQDRFDLVAQEQHRHDQKDRRCADHPEQEDLRIRGIGGAALGEDAHHRVIELNADFDQVGAADGVDPERFGYLPAQLTRERLVEQREERLRAGRRHVADGEEIHYQPQPLLGDAPQLRAVLVLRIALVDVDQGGDILHHRRREMPRHRVPVPFHEHERHHRLQHHHRHDHDQERAGIKPGRHPALERVAHPAIGRGNTAGGGTDQREAGVECTHRAGFIRQNS
ncbi:hypothetical protein GALL_536210 [mine drainage metagenome]|uniref:Uncharacterized protein n=1 Tax=mine drainage metagenome TaxID=410659 RepID=A0A1J5PHS5_9ZZZZ